MTEGCRADRDRTVSVSILMPAYNEASHIVPSVEETVYQAERLGWDYEIVVVDDGSRDGTFERVRTMALRNPRIRAVRIPKNVGKGSALRRGFRASRRGDFVVFLDCDLDLHPRQMETLFQVMRRTGADIVIGSKRHPRSQVNYPWHRRLVSWVYFTLVWFLFRLPLRDTQTGLKLFRRDVLRTVFPKLLVKRWAFDLELLVLAHHHGFKIAHAPVVIHSPRLQSRVRLSGIFHTLWDTLAIFYRLKILHWYERKEHLRTLKRRQFSERSTDVHVVE